MNKVITDRAQLKVYIPLKRDISLHQQRHEQIKNKHFCQNRRNKYEVNMSVTTIIEMTMLHSMLDNQERNFGKRFELSAYHLAEIQI